MHSNPIVKVAIPVYNVEGYVERCINSVLNQDYQNIEILITYDVSDDNSLQVAIDALKKGVVPYRIIEKSEEERGLGKSRNVVLDNFQGDYLYFLDSDDYIEPFTITLLVSEAISNDADIVAASHCSFDESENNVDTFQYAVKKIFDNSLLKYYIYVDNGYFSVYSWNKLYKKSFLRDNNIKCIHDVVEDAVFSFLAIEKAKKTVVLPDITLHYLIRNSSITNKLMYNDISSDTARVYLSIRDYKYAMNKGINTVETICCNIDSFMFGYISTVRNSYNSRSISNQEKLNLCKSAFITPYLPIKYFFTSLYSKKANLILLLVVKILPFRFNMLLVKLYHKIKSV